MAQDYAKRSTAARRPAARKNATPPPPPPPPKRPLWLALVVLVLVGGLGWGLYLLSNVEADPQVTQQSVQQSVQQAIVTPPAPVKRAPKAVKKLDPQYDFYKLLPDSEVTPAVVDAYVSTPRSAADYSNHLLQAGSFRHAEDAERLRARLLLSGMPNVTKSRVVSSSGTVWYRVRIGPFPSRSKLSKAYDQLVRMNLQPMELTL
ncbi:MAG: cell division protein FtsN [Motiliproteus sp.]|jgi:cell division protein FtsN